MTPPASPQTPLNALWACVVGVVSAISLTIITGSILPQAAVLGLGTVGFLFVAAGFHFNGRRRTLLLLIAGIALGGWRGFEETQRRDTLDTLLQNPQSVVLRVNMTVLEGWSVGRWGHTTKVRIHGATHNSRPVSLPRRCRLEIRNCGAGLDLPMPGTSVRGLVALKGTSDRLLLVAASPSLLTPIKTARGTPALREYLAVSLIKAGGTDAGRIRAAELAAALALGRRDLVPIHRTRGWRASGLGHALAVSGLHVGIVSGTLWLLCVLLVLQPTTIRWILLVTVPGYTILAGAAPSAVRACLMVCLYLAARLLGRAAMPLATVMTAALAMLLVSPGLVFNAGFQLTVCVTAALIRWAPPLTERLRGPHWLRGAIAVPIVAQVAAAPIVAFHFKTAIPLAAIVNLAIPLLLTPTIPLAVGSAILAPMWPGGAGWILDAIRFLTNTLWTIGGLGRHWNLIVPTVPGFILFLLFAAGLMALRFDRFGRAAGALWIVLLVLSPIGWFIHPEPPGDIAELLPVGDGLALRLTAGGQTSIFDGGHYRSEAAEMLADRGVRRLGAVIVSHGDEDHFGGIQRLLETTTADTLIIPSWLMSDAGIVPILRAARLRGTTISTVARGSLFRCGPVRFDVLWPPAETSNLTDNDRSLVIKARMPSGSILLTADIGASIERALARTSYLKADLLVAPHHGSASSTSNTFLNAVSPTLVLIPAGPNNRHHHPHSSVLSRLNQRSIPFVYPARDGPCGALADKNHQWQKFPANP